MKGFANIGLFLVLTGIMLIVGACDIYYLCNGKWLMGALFLLLFLLHIFLIFTDCGTFIEIGKDGVLHHRLGRRSLEMSWEEIAEWGVVGTGIFLGIGKKIGARYLYFSRKELSNEERFDMCLHWPPKDKAYITYTPKRFHFVMQNDRREPAYYNVERKDLRI